MEESKLGAPIEEPKGADTKLPEANPKPLARNVQLSFNGKAHSKLEVPARLNLLHEWSTFQDTHKFIPNKSEAFPAAFIGDLCTKLNCHRLSDDAETTETENFNL